MANKRSDSFIVFQKTNVVDEWFEWQNQSALISLIAKNIKPIFKLLIVTTVLQQMYALDRSIFALFNCRLRHQTNNII